MTQNQSKAVEPCLCGKTMTYYYEGSHDWEFTCNTCFLSKGFYIPHLGDETEAAIIKWNEWVNQYRPIAQSVDEDRGSSSVDWQAEASACHKNNEELNHEVERLRGNNSRLGKSLRDEQDRGMDNIIEKIHLNEKLQRYEKALTEINKWSSRCYCLEEEDDIPVIGGKTCPTCIACEALSPQPIEPTVENSARVQVSALECLEWCFKAQNFNLSYNPIQREYVVWKLTGPETMEVILRDETALSAIRSAMAKESN